jgi:hypothetical protein
MTITTNEVCKTTTVTFHSINHISMAATPASDGQIILWALNALNASFCPDFNEALNILYFVFNISCKMQCTMQKFHMAYDTSGRHIGECSGLSSGF